MAFGGDHPVCLLQGDRASEAALEKHVPGNIVTRRDLAYGEVPDEIFDINRPGDANAPLPTIVWVHGGGWIAGSKDGVANYLKVLAGRGYTTVGVEYSTGFGATYPKPVEQVNAALGYLVRNAADLGIDPDAIVLAGDSAGAQIAAQISIITTDPAYAERIGIAPALEPRQLAAVLLLSGAYDIGSVDLDGDQGWFLRTVLWAYSGTRNFLADERFMLASVSDHVTAAFPARLHVQRQRRSAGTAGGGIGPKAWRTRCSGRQPVLPGRLRPAASARIPVQHRYGIWQRSAGTHARLRRGACTTAPMSGGWASIGVVPP